MATATITNSTKLNMNAPKQQVIPSTLRYRPMPAPFVEDRSTAFAVVQTPETPAPCRRCLQDSVVGEEMLLISYDPFLGDSPYRGATAIFVHSAPCAPAVFPASGGILPEQQRRRVLAVRSYDGDHMMQGFEIVDGDRLLETCEKLLGDDTTAEYCHVHYAGPGCFAVRVEKASLPN
ncbi:hypothetical protein F4859DRAFT_512510 [Xylaria cf. heliscus]|nr:hypothetical protein F4859DRAFT_512510 [Xylaria cf. heliscus]